MAHDVKLGVLIDETQQRDAIHIAIAPVVADTELHPGMDIGFVGNDTTLVGYSPTPIGIVDPFLKRAVTRGQRFWMFLYPQTITSLRHDWAHPAFPDYEQNHAVTADPEGESKRWIENFATKLDQTYSRLMGAADRWREYGDYTYDNSEIYKSHWDEFEEFWKHYEIVTGEKVEDKSHFFTCSC